VQAARYLVAVLVELAAGVQHGQDDLGRAALRFVLVVELHANRNAAPVVGNRNRVVGVDDDLDVVAPARQRLVDGVVQHFEHHMVQAGAVGRIADVHAGPLAHRFQAFQLLDAVFVVASVHVIGHRVVGLVAHGVYTSWGIAAGCCKVWGRDRPA